MHLHDLHATIVHLLGIDHEKLIGSTWHTRLSTPEIGERAMAHKSSDTALALGFRVKTGRAVGIALSLSKPHPVVIRRCPLKLSDPDVPESFQPYHAGLEIRGADGERVVRLACNVVRKVGKREVESLVEAIRGEDWKIAGVGLVVGSRVDPATLANAHMRAHASEGRLFWKAVQDPFLAGGHECRTYVEREIYSKVAGLLRLTEPDLRHAVQEMGRTAGRPWTAEEKAATLAAWAVFAGH